MGLSQGSSNSLKIADFGFVSKSIRLIIVMSSEQSNGVITISVKIQHIVEMEV